MTVPESILCPGCKRLISSYLDECSHCGFSKPARIFRLSRLLSGSNLSFVKIIIIANVVMMVLAYLLPLFLPIDSRMGRDFGGLLPTPSNLSLFLLGWADPRRIMAGQWWLLITAMFLHGGLLHLGFNMLWFNYMAPRIEAVFSAYKMLIIYVISGITGNLTAVATPLLMLGVFGIARPLSPVIGASGAVFGLIGAMIAVGRKSGSLAGRMVARQLWSSTLIMIVLGFLMPNISNAAHIGGFIGGYLTGFVMPIRTTGRIELAIISLSLGTLVLVILSFAMVGLRLLG